jgi:hypothetical protein
MCNVLGWKFLSEFKNSVTGAWDNSQLRTDTTQALAFQLAFTFHLQGVTNIDTEEIARSLRDAVDKKSWNGKKSDSGKKRRIDPIPKKKTKPSSPSDDEEHSLEEIRKGK